ncbi:MAG: hypothetical protein IID40_02725 [Planctomycetes bacterium]|nr:hypothetical protein [Planctomycetota bacterium]
MLPEHDSNGGEHRPKAGGVAPAVGMVDGTPATKGQPLPLAKVADYVLAGLPLAVLVFDRDLAVTYRNRAAEQLFCTGNNVATLLAAGTAVGQHGDWPNRLEQLFEAGTASHQDNVVFTAGKGAAGERLLNLVCTPLAPLSDGPVTAGVLVAEDITTRAGLEKRLAVSERMAAVGQLAARVAHELNNPLDGILRYINLSLRQLERGDVAKVVEYLTESRQGLLRMAQITGDLLDYSRSSQTHFDEMNINRTVEEAIRTMQDKADRSGVTIAAAYRDDRMPSLRGGMLFQVCCNLVKNAIDAMPDGGRLTVSTAVVDDEVVLRFEDTGLGLPEPVEQVFEPFFTTKSPGQGTGLGLAICKDYAERLRGRIVAQHRRPTGAVFTVYLPLASCTAPHK